MLWQVGRVSGVKYLIFLDDIELYMDEVQVPVQGEAFHDDAGLTRYMTRLCGEALQLGADTIQFISENNGVTVSLSSDKNQLRSASLETPWYERVGRWLHDRRDILFGDLAGFETDERNQSFPVALRVADRLLIGTVKRTTGRLQKTQTIFSQFRTIALSQALDRLSLTPQNREVFDALSGKNLGVLCVAAPNDEALARTLPFLLSITGLPLLGVPSRGLGAVPGIIKIRSEDPIDVLMKCHESGMVVSEQTLRGVLVHGFVKSLCRHCARESVLDKALLQGLPEGLRPPSEIRYLVGRGCNHCGNSGYSGNLGVSSILSVDSSLTFLFEQRSSHVTLVEAAMKCGMKPLLEDGLAKVWKGQTTLESIYQLTQVLPDAYVRYFKGIPRSKVPNPDSSPIFNTKKGEIDKSKAMVLVVEDDPDQQGILEMVLSSAGYKVALAENGEKALSFLARTVPDLIVSDLMMPVMDGAELVKKLKANTFWSQIPVLVLTVVSDFEKEFTLLNLGADDYCEKTIQRKILLKRVENLLKRSKNGQVTV